MQFQSWSTHDGRRRRTKFAITFFVAFTIVWALASNKVHEVAFQQNRNCFAFSSVCLIHKFTRNNIDRFIDGLSWRDCCQTRLLIVTCSSRRPKVVTCLSIKNALHWDTSFSDPFHAYKNHAVSKLMHWLWPPASNNICFFVAFTIVWALASNKVDEVPFQQNRNCFAFSSACCTHVRHTRSPGITLTTWLMVSVDETVAKQDYWL